MRPALLLLAIALAPAAELALDTAEVETLDEHAWVDSVSRRRQSVASAPAPVEVVLYEDIVRSPASTLPDRLRYVPGVDVYQYRHGQYEVGLRGYNGGMNARILVLQDDWPFRLGEIGSPIWSGYIDLSDLDRVEVSKGPASVTYGANAFGGVIALKSRPVGNRPTLTVVGRAGDPLALDGDVTVAGPLGRGAFYGKASAGLTRLWDLPGVEVDTPFKPNGVNAEDIALDTTAWRARILAGMHLTDAWIAEAFVRTVRLGRWEALEGSGFAPPTLAITDHQLGLELRSPWLRLQHLERRNAYTYQNLKPDDGSFPFLYFQYGFADSEHVSRARVDQALGAHQLGAGVERTGWSGRSNLWRLGSSFADDATWETVNAVDFGAFAEDQWTCAPGLLLSAGGRIDSLGDGGTHLSPRLAINWIPGPRSFTLLSFSGGYRPPTYLERFQRDTFVAPSQDLGPESIHAIELQWRFRDGRDHEVSLGMFANRSNNQIWRLPLSPAEQQRHFLDWVNGLTMAPGPQFAFRNLDNPTSVLGAEVGGRLTFAQSNTVLWTNATWQHYRLRNSQRFQSAGFELVPGSGDFYYRYDYTLPREVNGPPEWKAQVGAEWTRSGWFASVVSRYVSGRTVYDIGHSQLLHGQSIALQHLAPYLVCDLGLGWRADASGRSSIRLGILDVFNSGHTESYRTTPAQLISTNESQYTSDIGRQLSLTMGWEY
jgi:outer membrane receptor protein involved in Fe transport